MSRLKFCIIGAFKHGRVDYNGQTTKVRNYSNEIRNHYPNASIEEIDTWRGDKFSYGSIIKAIKGALCSDIVIILPGMNGLKVFLPITSIMKRIRHYLLLYPVVGGWLPEYVNKHKVASHYLHGVDRVYVETTTMMDNLCKQGFVNVEHAPVFTRRKALLSNNYHGICEPISLCTFSRVTKDKGISCAVEAVQLLNEKNKRRKYTLDIYGQCDSEYKNELQSLISKDKFEAVNYCGTLRDDEVLLVLSKHSAMLFPSSYQGEGFPATVLEGMMAGLPVIASNWRYNGEIIKEGYNGYLFELQDGAQGLANKIEDLTESAEEADAMHCNCVEEAKKHFPETVLQPMYELIEIYEREKR